MTITMVPFMNSDWDAFAGAARELGGRDLYINSPRTPLCVPSTGGLIEYCVIADARGVQLISVYTHDQDVWSFTTRALSMSLLIATALPTSISFDEIRGLGFVHHNRTVQSDLVEDR